jgi:DNA phosphorothioation-associated putative methyltransferase
MESAGQAIARHKTAIGRTTLSQPIRFALTDGILTEDKRLLDYGCGRGDDLRILQAMGYEGSGWDPVHRPDGPAEPAPVVNLGYVVNVIENPDERRETLRRAWSLAEQVLVVSARLAAEANALNDAAAFADGRLTSRGTFQKLFEQHELKNWIDQTLGASALPAGPGVFYVFQSDETRSAFLASRQRRQIAIPRIARPLALYEQYKDILAPLLDFVAARGRLPADDEIPNAAKIQEVFGSTKRAFRIVEQATNADQWDEITRKRALDLLVYLALARFDGRRPFTKLSPDLQLDIKGFFSSYAQACREADDLLFAVGDPAVVDGACAASPIGKLTPDALYVHESAIAHLSPLLRIFEGCARGYIGRVDGANLIKLSRREPKISYLSYPDFEGDPHPALVASVTVHFQTFRVRFHDYRDRRNPPILHRKETFLPPDHPLYAKFARLTRIEETKGLYDDPPRIGTRDGWNAALAEKGLHLRGHRLVRSNSGG